METLQTVGTWFASPSGQVAIVIAVFALTIVAFIADKVRSDIVALSSLALLLVTNVLTPGEALAGFSNSAVVMMIGRLWWAAPCFKRVWRAPYRDACSNLPARAR